MSEDNQQKNKSYGLTKPEIRWANNNTHSAMAAARLLGVDFQTYRKYAKMYNMFEEQKNKGGKGTSRFRKKSDKYDIESILRGEHQDFQNFKKLMEKLIEGGYMKEECQNCGFKERRVSDGKVPLLLDHINGDLKDHRYENLRILCYNCYFLLVGNLSFIPYKYGNAPKAKKNELKED